jgi:hypothetical protein
MNKEKDNECPNKSSLSGIRHIYLSTGYNEYAQYRNRNSARTDISDPWENTLWPHIIHNKVQDGEIKPPPVIEAAVSIIGYQFILPEHNGPTLLLFEHIGIDNSAHLMCIIFCSFQHVLIDWFYTITGYKHQVAPKLFSPIYIATFVELSSTRFDQ